MLKIESAIQEGLVTPGGTPAGPAESESRLLIKEMVENNSFGIDYAKATISLSYILSERATSEVDVYAASQYFAEARAALEDAETKMLELADQCGWIGNCPLTYHDIRSNEMAADMKPPQSSALLDVVPGKNFRACVDVSDAVSPSALSNLYFDSVRLIAYIRLNIATSIAATVPKAVKVVEEEDLLGGGEDDMEVFETKEEVSERAFWKTSVLAMKCAKLTHPIRLARLVRFARPSLKMRLDSLRSAQLVKIALYKGELALATLRHVAHPHPSVRANILLIVGEMRMLECQRGQEEEEEQTAAEEEEQEEEDDFVVVENSSDKDDAEYVAKYKEFVASSKALVGALQVSFQSGGFNRLLMRKSCLHLANLYGKTTFTNSNKIKGKKKNFIPEKHLQEAIHFLVLAADVVKMHRKLFFNVRGLVGEQNEGKLSENGKSLLPENVLIELKRANESNALVGGEEEKEDTTKGLLHHFLGLIRERNLRSYDFSLDSRICRLHAIMYTEVSDESNPANWLQTKWLHPLLS